LDYEEWIYKFWSWIKLQEFMGFWWSELFKLVCGVNIDWCTKEEGQLINLNPGLDDKDRFQVYMGHSPGGTSVKTVKHMLQTIKAGKFQLWDYGSSWENMNHYGADYTSPPEVNLKKI
jgi:hypothetical protein